MSVVKLLADEDFDEYARLSLEAYPAMFTGFSDEQKDGWIKQMQAQQFVSTGQGDVDFLALAQEEAECGRQQGAAEDPVSLFLASGVFDYGGIDLWFWPEQCSLRQLCSSGWLPSLQKAGSPAYRADHLF